MKRHMMPEFSQRHETVTHTPLVKYDFTDNYGMQEVFGKIDEIETPTNKNEQLAALLKDVVPSILSEQDSKQDEITLTPWDIIRRLKDRIKILQKEAKNINEKRQRKLFTGHGLESLDKVIMDKVGLPELEKLLWIKGYLQKTIKQIDPLDRQKNPTRVSKYDPHHPGHGRDLYTGITLHNYNGRLKAYPDATSEYDEESLINQHDIRDTKVNRSPKPDRYGNQVHTKRGNYVVDSDISNDNYQAWFDGVYDGEVYSANELPKHLEPDEAEKRLDYLTDFIDGLALDNRLRNEKGYPFSVDHIFKHRQQLAIDFKKLIDLKTKIKRLYAKGLELDTQNRELSDKDKNHKRIDIDHELGLVRNEVKQYETASKIYDDHHLSILSEDQLADLSDYFYSELNIKDDYNGFIPDKITNRLVAKDLEKYLFIQEQINDLNAEIDEIENSAKQRRMTIGHEHVIEEIKEEIERLEEEREYFDDQDALGSTQEAAKILKQYNLGLLENQDLEQIRRVLKRIIPKDRYNKKRTNRNKYRHKAAA